MIESIETRLEYLSNLPLNYRVYYMDGVRDALKASSMPHNREEVVSQVRDYIDAVWAEDVDTETAARNIVSYIEAIRIEE